VETLVMKLCWPVGSTGRCLTVLVLAGALIGVSPGLASASACLSWTGTPPVNPSSTGDSLAAVSVLSSCDAWAVGSFQMGVTKTLAEHWDGTAWTSVPSSNPGGGDDEFEGVAARSPADAWAVGGYYDGTAFQTLTELLSGGVWEQVSSPDPGGSGNGNFLNAVTITSAKDAWAVGDYSTSPHKGSLRTLIEQWNGVAWHQVPSSSAINSVLNGVSATSATNAWAVGTYDDGQFVDQTLIEHWNGKTWSRVPSPDPSGAAQSSTLTAVAASSPSDAWAVGGFAVKGVGTEPLIVHWNGKSWTQVKVPSLDSPSLPASLYGVTIISASDAWATGFSGTSSQTLIAHWNGKIWSRVPSPSPGTSFSQLRGIAASSATNIWAVGTYSSAAPSVTFAVHCC
jgi:hypothetical protein